MALLSFILWIVIASFVIWLLLPLIGFGLLFFLAILAVLFVINIFSGKSKISFHTFRETPTEKAREAKAEQEESFDAEYGDDAGEFVELPPSALHKEEQN